MRGRCTYLFRKFSAIEKQTYLRFQFHLEKTNLLELDYPGYSRYSLHPMTVRSKFDQLNVTKSMVESHYIYFQNLLCFPALETSPGGGGNFGMCWLKFCWFRGFLFSNKSSKSEVGVCSASGLSFNKIRSISDLASDDWDNSALLCSSRFINLKHKSRQ